MLAEPQRRAAGLATAEGVRWLDFAPASGPAVRLAMPAPDRVATGTADPPWPTPAECYLAELAAVTSMSIGASGGTVELDTALLAGGTAAGRGGEHSTASQPGRAWRRGCRWGRPLR
jgi:hypothetical protein